MYIANTAGFCDSFLQLLQYPAWMKCIGGGWLGGGWEAQGGQYHPQGDKQ